MLDQRRVQACTLGDSKHAAGKIYTGDVELAFGKAQRVQLVVTGSEWVSEREESVWGGSKVERRPKQTQTHITGDSPGATANVQHLAVLRNGRAARREVAMSS